MRNFYNKHNWKFILLYFFPLCWMYKATLSNNFGISSTITSLMLASRGLTIVVFSVFGWMMMSKAQTSTPVKRALSLSVYMLIVTFLTIGSVDISTLAMLFFWSVTFFITERNILSIDDVGLIAIIASVVCNLMAVDVIIHYPQLAFLSQFDSEQQVAASNSIYYVMSSAIFIFILRNNFMKIVFLVLPCLAMLLVGKSTCLLAMAASVYFYFHKVLFKSHNRVWIIAGILAAGGFVAYLGNNFFNISDTIAGFSEDVDSGGNGRLEIWTAVLQKFASSDFFHMLFGNGPQAVSKAVHLGGHNDFVEIIFDFGFIGIIIYLSFWLSLLLRIQDFAAGTETRLAYIVSLIVYAAASMFSNFINTQIQMLFFVMFWGIVYNQRTENNNNAI